MPMLLLTISGVLTIAGFFSKFGWWFDMASYFHLQYLALQALCILLCIPKKQWKLLGFISVFAVLNLSLIVPLYIPSQQTTQSKISTHKTLTMLQINVFSANSQYTKAINYIKKINPDILALEEINNEWLTALSDVLSNYPYSKAIPRGDNFGIGLFSKVNPEDITIKYYGSAEVPSILTNFTFGDRPLTLLFTHPVPPASLQYYRWRNEQLEDIASQRSSFNDSLIVVGDLNSTSWSYHFRNFTKKMKLLDSRKGFGLHTTWPAMLPIMAITIDHILVSPDINVLEHNIGPHIGSDHKPVFVKLAL